MPWRCAILLAGAALVGLAAGCAMVRTEAVSTPTPGETACAEGGIAYYLPRRKISVTLRVDTSRTPPRSRLSIAEGLVVTADREAAYCLRTVGSPLSIDQIGVETDNGLLTKVFTKADDQTVRILERVAEGVGRGVTAAAGFRATAADVEKGVLVYGPMQVDPFDESEMRVLNEMLAEFDYCVHLDSYADPFVPDWAPRLCGRESDPAPARPGLSELGAAPAMPPEPWGVLYRPLLSHRLVVLRRQDPEVPDSWATEATRVVRLPNAAPAFGIAVKRAAFTERETRLTFDAGVLTDVSVKKGSELNALVTLPITLAQIAVSIPADILRLRLSSTRGRTALLDANQKLIDSLIALETARALRGETRREVRPRLAPGRWPGIATRLGAQRPEAERIDALCRLSAEMPDVSAATYPDCFAFMSRCMISRQLSECNADFQVIIREQ